MPHCTEGETEAGTWLSICSRATRLVTSRNWGSKPVKRPHSMVVGMDAGPRMPGINQYLLFNGRCATPGKLFNLSVHQFPPPL